MSQPDYAVVILYYKFGPRIIETVRSFLTQTVPPLQIVIVDNGSNDSVCQSLFKEDDRVTLVSSPDNTGYSGGMRLGMRATSPLAKFILFSTHEVQLKRDAAREMLNVMANTGAAQVGPALMNAETGRVWSYGGILTSLGSSKHLETTPSESVIDAQWLDGCCFLVKNDETTFDAFDPRYFLYWEDIHFSTAMASHGRILVATRAIASQTTGTTPPYFAARNRILFWRIHRRRDLAVLATVSNLPRIIVRTARGESLSRALGTVRGSIDGWTGALRPAGTPSIPTRAPVFSEVRLINPLGAALAHYTKEFSETLHSAGISTSVVSISEPSQGRSRISWVVEYIKELARSRRHPSLTLSTWPVLGIFDVIIVRLLAGKSSSLVVHDPTPLVRAIGYGRLARILARRAPGPRLITHSTAATVEVASWQSRGSVVELPHPILPTNEVADHSTDINQTVPIVRVLGQWKSSRDLAAMRNLAAGSYRRQPVFEVVGRGWPEVPGWRRVERFVPEDELDALIRHSDVIVIPYSRFYQSGIAIRALENCTAVVGPADSSLVEVFGRDSKTLVSDGNWREAVAEALELNTGIMEKHLRSYQYTARMRYKQFVQSVDRE